MEFWTGKGFRPSESFGFPGFGSSANGTKNLYRFRKAGSPVDDVRSRESANVLTHRGLEGRPDLFGRLNAGHVAANGRGRSDDVGEARRRSHRRKDRKRGVTQGLGGKQGFQSARI